MINHRVDNRAEMLAQLRAAGVAVVNGPESHENGKFAWIVVPLPVRTLCRSTMLPFSFPLVLLSGLYFVLLAATALLAPARATRFLLGLAQTARTHYLELGLRALAGGAFILQAPAMRFEQTFAAFGWVLLVTTAGLLLVPWRWHQAFAKRVVPHATRHLIPVGLVSLALGGFVWVSALVS